MALPINTKLRQILYIKFSTNYKLTITLCLYHSQIYIFQINVLEAKRSDEIHVQSVYPQLIVVEGEPSSEILKKISSSNAFVFTKTTDLALNYSDIIELVRFEVKEKEYSIYKRVSQNFFGM